MSQQRYEVKGKIGHGGLGEVYLAQDTQLDREVALKRMKPPEDGTMDALAEDLIREAKTLSSLQHPNIVTVYDVGRDEKGPFLVLELLKGETLDSVIERGGMTLDDFRQVVVQTLEGLVAAQSVGLVHRDLKPGNLMVVWLPTGKFQIKILDFGLAKFSQKAKPQTQDHEGGIFGSIFFMAPEQFERLPLDARTDMYSLGCIYYQILTTKHPFDGETAVEVMASHLQHHVTPLRQLRPDLPEWLGHWVMWLISREMDDRPPDARVALEFFQSERHGLKGVPPPPSVATPKGQPSTRVVRPGAQPRTVVPGQPAGQWHGQPPPVGTASQQLRAGTAVTSRSSTPALQRLPKSGGRKGLWIGLGIGAALLAGAAGWFFFLRNPEADPNSVLRQLASEANPYGTPATVHSLADVVNAGGNEARQAADVLKKLSGADLGDAVLTELERSTSLNARLLFLEILTSQSATPKRAVQLLLKTATDNTGAVREAVFRALPLQTNLEEVPTLLKAMAGLKDDGVRLLDAVDNALDLEKDVKVREKVMLTAMREAPASARQRFHQMLGKIDSQEARIALRNDITSTDPAIQKAALMATPSWPPHGSVANSILQAVQKGADRELAMKVYCDITLRMDTTGPDRVGMLKKAEKDVSGTARLAWQQALASIADQTALDYAKSINDQAAVDAIKKLIGNRIVVSGPEAKLPADKAVIVGKGDASYTAASKTVSAWKDPQTKVAWDLELKAAGPYYFRVIHSSSETKRRTFRVVLGEASPPLPVMTTAKPEEFATVEGGPLNVPRPGTYRLWIEPVTMEKGTPLMNLREIVLEKK